MKYHIEYTDTIDSTNTAVKRRAVEGAEGGLVLVAGRQTAGRGRMGRQFFSPEGAGLYMSLLVRPVRLDGSSCMTHLVAVAVARALSAIGIEADIKWVNDLLVGGRKLCGILVESGWAAGESFAVIGIGLNLTRAAFPAELAPIVVSAEEILGKAPDRDALIQLILTQLGDLLGGDAARVAEAMGEYRRRCITIGREVTVLPHGQEGYEAFAESVNADGSLRVRLLDGSERDIATGEVSVKLSP